VIVENLDCQYNPRRAFPANGKSDCTAWPYNSGRIFGNVQQKWEWARGNLTSLIESLELLRRALQGLRLLCPGAFQLFERPFVLLEFLARLSQFALGGKALIFIEFLDSFVYQLLDAGHWGRLTG